MIVTSVITETDMPRNLDLAALRALVTAAEAGGVTRAAGRLNLTQSAVSMQLKRLEEAVGRPLVDRSGRGFALTAEGELLMGYARRLVALNDEAWTRLTAEAFEGQIAIGAPHDVIQPHLPRALQRFARAYPRVRVQLQSQVTTDLKREFARGALDLILTTEAEAAPGAEALARHPLIWVGAQDGQAWRSRPLPFATSRRCVFQRPALDALEAAGLPWEIAVDAEAFSAIDAAVSADLAVCVQLANAVPPQCAPVRHAGALPELPDYAIAMHVAEGPKAALAAPLAEMLREAYRDGAEARAA